LKKRKLHSLALVLIIATLLVASNFIAFSNLFHSQGAINPDSISVEGTLILANNTLVPGNDAYPLPILEPLFPAMVIDPISGNLFAPGDDPNQFIVFNVNSNSTSILGNDPNGLAYDPIDNSVFASYNTGVRVYNGTSQHLEENISTGYLPGTMATDTSNGAIYVSDTNNSITVISPSFLVIANITSNQPLSPANAICYDPKNNELYVGVANSNLVSIIDAASNKVIGSIDLNSTPGAIVYNAADGDIYVSQNSLISNAIAILDPQQGNKIVATVHQPDYGPYDLVYDPSNGYVYASNYLLGGTEVISGTSEIAFLNDTSGPLAYDSANGYLYTATIGRSNVGFAALGPSNNVARFYFDRASPDAMALDPNNGMLYVADGDFQEIYAINTQTNTIAADIVNSTNWNSGGFQSVTFDPENNGIYAAGYSGILVVNATTNKIAESITSPAQKYYPDGIAYDSVNHEIYVDYTNPSDQVFALNDSDNQIEATIAGSSGSNSMTVDPQNGEVFIAATNSTIIIDALTNRIIANLTIPFTPENPYFDTADGNVYLPLPGANAVGIYSRTDTANQVESYFTTPFFSSSSLTFASNFGDLYIISTFNDSLSIVNPNTLRVISNLAIGAFPQNILYDPTNGLAYVVDFGGGTISIIGSPLYITTQIPTLSLTISSQFQTISTATNLSTSAKQPQHGVTFANEFGIIVIGSAVVAVALILSWEFIRRRRKS
jgi:YVTN family beta-propeller protein